MRRISLFAVVALAAAVPATGRAQLIGTGTGANCFPFGCGPGTRYQQVYAASDFLGIGSLSSVSFFLDPAFAGAIEAGTYSLYVSTTSAAVNGLNTTNFDANDGANNTLFGTYVLSGSAPGTLTFSGSGFVYNPAAGNLLLDFHIVGGSGGSAYFKANNGDAGGVYSRAHDFGTGFNDWGLQTQFNFTAVNTVPEPATMSLLAMGLVGISAVRRRRKA